MSERELWQSVLLRAVEDAFSEPPKGSANAGRRHEILDARAYLTRPSKDLWHVCSLAGVDMEALTDRMRKRIADASQPNTSEIANPDRPRISRLAKRYEFEGQRMTLKQLSEMSGVSAGLIGSRLRKKWPIEAALNPENLAGKRVTEALTGVC